MKDELTKDQWLAKQSQEFKVIRYCKECGSRAYWLAGDGSKGWYECENECTIILDESKIETVYQCSLCLEEHEDEECNCYG